MSLPKVHTYIGLCALFTLRRTSTYLCQKTRFLNTPDWSVCIDGQAGGEGAQHPQRSARNAKEAGQLPHDAYPVLELITSIFFMVNPDESLALLEKVATAAIPPISQLCCACVEAGRAPYLIADVDCERNS